jgi:hypothetical protein
MSISNFRSSGAYKQVSAEAVALTADHILAGAVDSPFVMAPMAPTLVHSLQVLAQESSQLILWTLETMTLLMIAIVIFGLMHAHDARQLLAFAIMGSFLTVSASIGGYLLSLKSEASRV